MNWEPNRRMPFALGCALAFSVLMFSEAHASAKSGLCRQLEANLAAASGGGSSAKARKYDRAIVAQRHELAKARSQTRDKCGFSLFGLGQCGKLNATIDKMERNLATLERERATMRGSTSSRERARIVASLNANGCRGETVAERKLPQPVEVEQRNAELLRKVFGDLAREELLPDEIYGDGERNVRRVLNPVTGLRFDGMDETYQTVCVRSCDGYMFPISNQSARLDFDRDQKNCEATCPGSEVELFYRRFGSAEPGDLISAATDTPYAETENAYLYKNVNVPRPATCGCAAPQKNFSIVAGNPRRNEPAAEAPTPSPLPPPDPGADPETIANAEGGLTVTAVENVLTPKVSLPPPPPSGQRKVRVVGPAFLPDQSEAIDLRAPGPTAVR